ncbi:MAG: MBL fold metallo-hydrolase [Propionibacteriaceae bacterium]|nr:MBL fold metallo-hydrolase [Micropruina sp.]
MAATSAERTLSVPDILSPHVVRVVAPNPSVMTLEGTNSYVVLGRTSCLVVDPGPAIPAHLAALEEAADGRPIRTIVATHHHLDHTESIAELAARTGAETLAADTLVGRADIGPDGVRVTALPTPGHTDDSISLLVADDRVLLTGDFILGRGTTVLMSPDGNLAAYLASLEATMALVRAGAIDVMGPGHGPMVRDPLGWLLHYQQHRLDRLAQVRAALDAGHESLDDLLDAVYPDATGDVRWAAAMSLQAQLDYLRPPHENA